MPYIILKDFFILNLNKYEKQYKNLLIFILLIMSYDDLNCYLGNKGYSILKSSITLNIEKKIRSELTISPKIHGCPISGKSPSYPAYRESGQKFYIPYYYGVKEFGDIKTIKIKEGKNIDIHFNGQLREIQKPVVESYINYVKNKKFASGLLELPCAFGKTVLALNIMSILKKKTLIIVHKEFLLNQWVERMREFLPNIRIGKIQGQVIDIDDKDVVIGMLQSLSQKNYPSSLFEDFGLTIIDEVHHISSESFSNVLFKAVTKNMLGLSATMNRKDGTTKVFKMFLGDIIFKGKREEQFEVEVRGIEYKVNDEEFDEVKYNYQGNPMYSTMISKLCTYNHRSEFILKIVRDLLSENNDRQIMILAHNKNLLKYFYDSIKHHNIASVGYYLGGMKEKDLKETEQKTIVIATYAMAAEALDIKTLSTLIMATPKTDIEQSVGRILRQKHNNPVVVDIIDQHDIFQKQWQKRKVFYKKENYKIISNNINNYNNKWDEWKVVFTPKQIISKEMTKNNIRKKNVSSKSYNSNSDKSITDDSDEEEVIENGNKHIIGNCLLKLK
jgi:superfamily II DNA or RNA helicase